MVYKFLFFNFLVLTITLQNYGMSVNRQLFKAIAENDIQQVISLIKSGADSNAKDTLGNTPLHSAVMYGCEDIVTHLLSHGANINAIGNNSYTPLHCATLYLTESSVTIIELLCIYGADLAAKCPQGVMFIDKIRSRMPKEIVDHLERYLKLHERAKNRDKKLLKAAIDLCYYSLVQRLLQEGILPDASDLALARLKYIEESEPWRKKIYTKIGLSLFYYLKITGQGCRNYSSL